ncbi:hypothetical protein [Paenibacillus xylanexedens]|uniref:hypothetical protein n=1 Tax=Paenibacillus xylanexedens TaxID=528191 RepID=UPI0011A29D48|nr:hypothetical protein [Paenibacillus xylanexedens]
MVYRVSRGSGLATPSLLTLRYDGTAVQNEIDMEGLPASTTPAHLVRNPNTGKLELWTTYLSGTYFIAAAELTQLPTSTDIFVSVDNGRNWMPATPGKRTEFLVAGTQIRVKFLLHAPTPYVSPQIQDFTIGEGLLSGDLSEAYSRAFVSAVIPFSFVTSRAQLTVTEDVGEGAIAWSLSNDGGVTWLPVTPGQAINFPEAGSGVKVKAVLTSPAGIMALPIVRGYRLSCYTQITETAERVTNLEINLAKSNFKIAALMNASRYGLQKMFVDDFSSDSGVDYANSKNALFDATLKQLNTNTAVNLARTSTYTAEIAAHTSYPDTGGRELVDGTKIADGVAGAYSVAQYTGYLLANGEQAITFLLANSASLDEFRVTAGSATQSGIRYPQRFIIEGSNDNTNWTLLTDQETGAVDFTSTAQTTKSKEFKILFENKDNYLYYRLKVSIVEANLFFFVSEVEFYNNKVETVLRSTPFETDSVPDKLLLVVDEPPGQGFTYEVSRDAGVTWTPILPNIPTRASSLPLGRKLVLRATADKYAVLSGWSLFWT